MYRNSDRCQVICESPLCLFSTASTLHDLKKFQWSWPKKYLVLIYIFSFTHCHLLALSLSHAFLLSLILFLSISLTRISPFSDSLSAYLFFLPLSDSLSLSFTLSLSDSLSDSLSLSLSFLALLSPWQKLSHYPTLNRNLSLSFPLTQMFQQELLCTLSCYLSCLHKLTQI